MAGPASKDTLRGGGRECAVLDELLGVAEHQGGDRVDTEPRRVPLEALAERDQEEHRREEHGGAHVACSPYGARRFPRRTSRWRPR
jgi:hypothetical protein